MTYFGLVFGVAVFIYASIACIIPPTQRDYSPPSDRQKCKLRMIRNCIDLSRKDCPPNFVERHQFQVRVTLERASSIVCLNRAS